MAWSTFTTSIAIYNAVFQSGAPCGSNSSITVAGNFAINSSACAATRPRSMRLHGEPCTCDLPSRPHPSIDTPCVGPAVLISGTSVYAKVSQCDNDNDPHGTAPAWYTDASCTTSPIPGVTSEYGGYGFCARAIGNAFGTTNGVSYIVSCKASPGSSAQGWVAALASFIVIGAWSGGILVQFPRFCACMVICSCSTRTTLLFRSIFL